MQTKMAAKKSKTRSGSAKKDARPAASSLGLPEWKAPGGASLGVEALLEALDVQLRRLTKAPAASGRTARGATDKQLDDARLRVCPKEPGLPPSLVAFYKASNGWSGLDPFLPPLLPAQKIGLLRDVEPMLYQVYVEDVGVLPPGTISLSPEVDVYSYLLLPPTGKTKGKSAWSFSCLRNGSGLHSSRESMEALLGEYLETLSKFEPLGS